MDVIESRELKLAGILVVGRRSELAHRVPMAWLELTRRLPEIPGARGDRFYGVFRDGDHAGDAGDGTYRYWTCVEVEGAVPDGLVALTVPAGRYLRGTIVGGPEQIDATYVALAGWIAEHGARSQGYGFELYETARQPVTPPYERFDYDVHRPVQ